MRSPVLLILRVVRCECTADAFREVYQDCEALLDLIYRLSVEDHKRSLDCHIDIVRRDEGEGDLHYV
jgi:hypothetical protein